MWRTRIAAAFFLLGVAVVACGCGAFERGPKSYPYVTTQVRTWNKPHYHRDLDGDGRDEILIEKSLEKVAGRPRSREALRIDTQSGQVINQINFAGEIIQNLQFVDLGEDGRLETIVPVLRRDSLFLVIVGADGQKRRMFFLTKGSPRTEPEGSLPWDPQLRGAHLADLTGDGRKELVTVMMTQLARRPRGVWVHDLETGKRLDRWTSGAMVDRFVFEDLVGGEAPELLAATGAPNNGARGGGMDDQHAYLFLLRLSPGPELLWKRQVGGVWATTRMQAGDVNGDGRQEYFVLRKTDRRGSEPGHLERIEPKTGQTIRSREIPAFAKDLTVVDLDGNGMEDILVAHSTGLLCLYGADFQKERCVRRGERDHYFSVVPNLLEGNPAIIVGPHLLGPDLQPEALLPAPRARWSMMERGAGRSNYLVGRTPEKTIYYRMVDNPAYLLYRWGPWGLLLLGVVLAGGLAVWGRRVYRRHQALRRERVDLTEDRDGGHLLVQADGTVEHVDEAARSLLGISEPRPEAALLAREVPDLSRVLDEIRNGAAEEGTRAVKVPTAGEEPNREPVQVRLKALGDESPHTWLLRLNDTGTSGTRDGPSYRTWSLLARRVAHDLKNPLTSILILVERLREETREHAPTLADEIGGYAERIENRVRSLRRMTTNFMKFVGDEESSLVRADLRAFVEERVRELRKDLPTDIELVLEADADLPAAAFDRDQMHSVLENLVTNAMDALPEGGTITVSVRVERGLRRRPAEEPRDYLALEVRDTGIGMDPDTRARLFDPGYTTSEEGAGLGLVITKKVVEDHGGHLEVESEEGIGTAVTVYLPAAEAPVQNEPTSEDG